MGTDVSQPVERKLILVRAKLSEEEWASLRKLAIDRNQSGADLFGEALRQLLRGEK